MTTVAIMQPTYLPWAGYLDLIDQADVFILLDTVQYERKSWHVRNRILARDGNVVWLTIPTRHAPQRTPLNEILIADDTDWRSKHRRTLDTAYHHTEWWPHIRDQLPFTDNWQHLAAYTGNLIDELALLIGINTPIYRASFLDHDDDDRHGRIASLCRAVGADTLLDTTGARDIIDPTQLDDITVRWHHYQPAPYDQDGRPFTPHLSVIDCLTRHGPDKTLDTIRAGRIHTPEKV